MDTWQEWQDEDEWALASEDREVNRTRRWAMVTKTLGQDVEHLAGEVIVGPFCVFASWERLRPLDSPTLVFLSGNRSQSSCVSASLILFT